MKKVNLKEIFIMLFGILFLGSLGIIIGSFLKFNVYLYYLNHLIFNIVVGFILYRFCIKNNITNYKSLSFSTILFVGTMASSSMGGYIKEDNNFEILAFLVFITSVLGAIYVLKRD